jgi:hypothetical protein
LIGACLITVAVRLGKCGGTLRAVGGTLQVEQAGLFGTKRWEWRREDIASLRSGDSNVQVNHRNLRELQICPVNGKKVGLFVGRNRDDLEWIAAKLRKILGVGAKQG